MFSCVSGERGAAPASAKVPTPPDSSRRAPEGRRRLRDYKLESKQSPTPVVMSNEPGPLPDLPGFPCSIPLSTDPLPCSSEMPPEMVSALGESTDLEALVQVKLEDPDFPSSLQETELTGLGDPMDCISESADLFNFLGDNDDPKINFSNLGLDSSFDPGIPDLSQDAMEGLGGAEPHVMGIDMSMEMRMDAADPGMPSAVACPSDQDGSNPVALGIPYYVACQWEQAQQVQAQQQQAAAYLCGACGVGGNGATAAGMQFPGQQLGWGMPHQLPSPTSAVPDGFFPHLAAAAAAGMSPLNTAGKAAGASASVPKRRRRQEGPGSSAAGGEAVNAANNKKGRRPKQEERVCKNCGTRSTPFWRKNKQDGLPLCNACGLYLAKNDTPRPKVLWKSGIEEPTSEACTEQHSSHDMMDIEVMGTKLEPDVLLPPAVTVVAPATVSPDAPAAHC